MAKDNSNDNKETMRHSLSHIMAAAVLDMFPEAKLGIGPSIENGFYYDFDLPRTLIPEDLNILEEKMRKLIKEDVKFEKTEAPIDAAIKEAKKKKEIYKLELLNALRQAQGKNKKAIKVSFFRTGNFVDLCRGPHVASTGKVGAFKLTKISGAYWRGDEKNKMLQRIYGAAFNTEKELNEHLKNLEEAEKRDHRKLGKELELFHIDETAGKGLPLWMPKGAIVRQILQRFIEDEETKRGYQRVFTPAIGNVKLYKLSGHWDHYKEEMYPAMKIDNEEYVLRPMSCPHQFMIYKARPKSYRELPVRYAELAEMYRREKSGELSGLVRLMGFTLNDAHIICRPDQLQEEFLGVIDLVKFSLKMLGLYESVTFRASLGDKTKEKYSKIDKGLFENAERCLINYLDKASVKYTKSIGDAAFYGPKLDIQIKNIHGKEETLITVQIDLVSANHFSMNYIDKDGELTVPMIIHRSAIGCIERTMAYLIEHYGGAFPLWLAPVQTVVIPISDKKHGKYAHTVANTLKESGIRVEVDERPESLGRRIRDNEMQKVPYILIVGDKEITSKKVSVRSFKKGDLGQKSLANFIKEIIKEVEDKK